MSRVIRGRGIIGTLGLLALLALVVAPAASAKKKKKSSKPGPVKTVTATVNTIGDNLSVTAVATCPKKTTAVGGGFALGSVDVGAPQPDGSQITESRRDGTKAWRVSAYRIDQGAAGPNLPVTAEVYCRENAGKISEVAAPESLTGTSVLLFSPSPVCPLGKAQVGGGFAMSVADMTNFSLFPYFSGPLGAVGWQLRSLSSGSTATSATAYVYCQKRKKGLAQTSGIAQLPPPDGGTLVTLKTAPCGGKNKALNGGFAGPDILQSGNGLPYWVESR